MYYSTRKIYNKRIIVCVFLQVPFPWPGAHRPVRQDPAGRVQDPRLDILACEVPDPLPPAERARGPPVDGGRVGPPLGQPALRPQLHLPPVGLVDVLLRQVLVLHDGPVRVDVLLLLLLGVVRVVAVVQASPSPRPQQQLLQPPQLHPDECGSAQRHCTASSGVWGRGCRGAGGLSPRPPGPAHASDPDRGVSPAGSGGGGGCGGSNHDNCRWRAPCRPGRWPAPWGHDGSAGARLPGWQRCRRPDCSGEHPDGLFNGQQRLNIRRRQQQQLL